MSGSQKPRRKMAMATDHDTDFEDLLDKSFDEVEEPPLVPTGPWIIQGIGNSYKDGSEGEPAKGNLGFTLVKPTDEVDPDKLAEVGEEWKGQRFWKRYTFEGPQDRWAVVQDLRALGVEGSATVKEMLKNGKLIKGRQAIGIVQIDNFTRRSGEKVVQSAIKMILPFNGE
jgi:hypothetical protein